MRRACILMLLVGCKRAPATDSPPPAPSPSVSVSAAPSVSATPMVDPAAHIAVLEEVAAVHAKKPPCDQIDKELAPLHAKMKALGDVSDPRLGRAIEADEALRARRTKALEAIMDGSIRCRTK